MKHLFGALLIAGSLFSATSQAAITFTGNVDNDFSDSQNCYEDDLDVGIVSGAGVTKTGWDVERLCFFYDGATETLYVGVKAHDNAIFGDADGDGDPSSSSATGILDLADLSGTESFVISMDLDGDSESDGFTVATVDVLLGVSDSGSLSNIGVYEPGNSYTLSNPNSDFGSKLPLTVTIFTSPSAAAPDLEFQVEGFNATNLGVVELADKPYIQFFAGSTDDAGIGDDFLPTVGEGESYPVYDGDEDGLDDWEEIEEGTLPGDSDSDDDGIEDGVEINGENPTDPLDDDSDDDGLLDGEEDENADGVVDEGETDPNNADTDDDGVSDGVEVNSSYPTDTVASSYGSSDPTNSDTDGDGLLDGEEDFNANGTHDADAGETNPILSDTDGGGVNDKIEIDNGFDPNDSGDDSDAEEVAIQAGTGFGYNQLQGGGMTCSLDTDAKPGSGSFVIFAILFSGLAFIRAKQKKLI